MHVKSNTPSHEFYAYVENTPYEISLPLYGINMTPEVFGSHWNRGIVCKKCPEFPLHFYLGSCGCAFAILFSYANSEAGEGDQVVVDIINGLRNRDEESLEWSKRLDLGISSFEKHAEGSDFPQSDLTSVHLEKHEPTSDLNDKLRQLDEEYLARSRLSDVAEKEERETGTLEMLDGENAERLERRKSIIQKEVLGLLPEGILEDFKKSLFSENARLEDLGADDVKEIDNDRLTFKRQHSEMTGSLRQQSMMKMSEMEQSKLSTATFDVMSFDRKFLFDRVAEVLNFSHSFDDIKVMRSPSTEAEDPQNELSQPGSRQHILRKIGFREAEPMTTEADNISVIDAGILKNVSLECVLRPERRSDLIIVFDMNAYESDSRFNYWPLVKTAVHAWKDGLKFPNINMEEVVNSPPQELLIFESDADDCPTIMWFTLSNKKFKEHKDYVPRSTAKPPQNNRRPFNDFTVFDDGNKYGTFKFYYSAYEFDQLHELMYYNVDSHVKEIKEQIAKAIDRKLRRLSSSS